MALLEMLLINDSTLAFFQKNEGPTGSTGSIFSNKNDGDK
jgi:hypothetical protein